mgnify:CR=1 FL=1
MRSTALAFPVLANAAATVGVLYAVILMFGEVSGAHLNPAVTLALVAGKKFPAVDAPAYVASQFAAAALASAALRAASSTCPSAASTFARAEWKLQ